MIWTLWGPPDPGLCQLQSRLYLGCLSPPTWIPRLPCPCRHLCLLDIDRAEALVPPSLCRAPGPLNPAGQPRKPEPTCPPVSVSALHTAELGPPGAATAGCFSPRLLELTGSEPPCLFKTLGGNKAQWLQPASLEFSLRCAIWEMGDRGQVS